MKKLAGALLLSAASIAPAFAADQGGYVAVDLGSATFSGANFGGLSGTLPFPNPGTFQLGGGFRFDQNLGVEGGLVFVGDSTINSSGGLTETLKTSAIYIAAVGTLPVSDQFDLFGKLGLSSTRVDYSSNFFPSATTSTGNLMFGLGGQFNINPNFGIRVQYENFGKADFPSGTFLVGQTTSIGLSTFTVGGVFSF